VRDSGTAFDTPGRRDWLSSWGLTLLCGGLVAFYSGAWIIRDVIFHVSPLPQAALRFLGLPLAALGGVLMLARPFGALRLALNNAPLLLLVLWAGLSVLWSIDPGTSLQRVIALVAALIAGLGLASWFGARDLARVCVIGTGIGMALSLGLFAIGDPLAMSPIGLRGAFTHKNVLGQVTAAGLVLAAGLMTTRGDRWLGAGVVALAIPCLVLAQSATAVAASAVGVGALALFALLGSRRLPAYAKPTILLGALLLAAMSALSFELVLELLGRNATLTGRDEIWRFTLERWAERPWLGYGFRAFWSASYNAGQLSGMFYTSYDQSHNGYLQVMLDLGLVGISLFAAWVVLVLWGGAQRLSSNGHAVWAALVLSLVVYSFAESILLTPNGFTWFILSLGGLALTRRQQEAAAVESEAPAPAPLAWSRGAA